MSENNVLLMYEFGIQNWASVNYIWLIFETRKLLMPRGFYKKARMIRHISDERISLEITNHLETSDRAQAAHSSS